MNRLIDCISEYTTIAVSGMCKNAGKTTVVNYLVREMYGKVSLGLTSIGYDGEEKDEITKLEKPRINVFPHMLAATCMDCLEKSTAGFRILKKTGINTVLGEVVLLRVTKPGTMEISGPSVVSQITQLCNDFRSLGCEKNLVDGSAGRVSFASGLDCMILAVGAALNKDMDKVVKLAKFRDELLSLPICDTLNLPENSEESTYYAYQSEDIINFVFRGSVVDEDLIEIMRNHRGFEKRIIVNNSAALFITPGAFRKFLHRKGKICTRSGINLVALTINPMSPYGKWFDKDKFLQEMKEKINKPIFNVMEETE